MNAACQDCHDVRVIQVQAMDADGWTRRVSQEIEKGAKVSKEDVPTLVNYLVRTHGPLPDGPGKEVILSAGAIQSPQLLMLSGVGPAAALQQLGLQPVHDLAGVGLNLQDHLDVMLVQNSRLAVSSGLTPKQLLLGPYNLYKLLAKGSGPLTANGAEGGGFVRSRPELDLPDVQFHFMPARLRDHGRDIPFMMGEGYSIHACNLKPKSRGQITLKSTDPLQAPAMQPNYLSTEADRRMAVAAPA